MKKLWLLPLICALFAQAVLASTDYAAWAKSNRDGSWTRLLEQTVRQSALVRLVPADIQQFCPLYPRLNSLQRSQFWVGLFSAMAKPESNFKPQQRYQEKFRDGRGRPVVSRGLLQISLESANQPRYNCQIRRADQLHDPRTNLNCAVKIMQKWVETDGWISQPQWSQQPKGGGRYWSTLREKTGKLNEISQFTRQLPACSSTNKVQRPSRSGSA